MSNAASERPIWIDCAGERMLGIVTKRAENAAPRRLGVLIAVGGPQYRVGSHRQFTLLARRLAAAGYPILRFDFRGMGDSEGAMRSFEHVGDDLRAAICALRQESPEVDGVVVWGMCDAASAALMFCAADPNVTGMILVNPWARSESSYAQATLKHYYRGQLLSAAFWRRLLGGEVAVVDALRSLLDNLKSARRRDKAPAPANAGDFRARMAAGMRKFPGPVLLLISGQDLTAREFVAHAGSDPKWHWLLDSGHIERADLPEADHTFSSATWRRWVEEKSLSWLDLISDQPQPHESRAPEPGLRDKPHAAGEPGWSAD